MRKRSPSVMALFRHVCKSQARALNGALQKLLAHPDEEAVHDVRVACRRLRVALRTAEPAFRRPLARATQDRLRTLMQLLGDVRDAEVFCERVARYARKRNELHAVHLAAMFHSEMELQRLRAVAEIERRRFSTLPRLLEALLHPMALRPKRARQFRRLRSAELATEILLKRLKRITKYDEMPENAGVDTLHQLRIQFKKFRYSAEFFAPAFGTHMHSLIKYAKAFQEVLGDLHDAHVAEERLLPWLREPNSRKAMTLPPNAELDYRLISAGLNEMVVAARQDQQRYLANFHRLWTARRFKTLKSRIAALAQPTPHPRPTRA